MLFSIVAFVLSRPGLEVNMGDTSVIMALLLLPAASLDLFSVSKDFLLFAFDDILF